jgi:hypothetical protein
MVRIIEALEFQAPPPIVAELYLAPPRHNTTKLCRCVPLAFSGVVGWQFLE